MEFILLGNGNEFELLSGVDLAIFYSGSSVVVSDLLDYLAKLSSVI